MARKKNSGTARNSAASQPHASSSKPRVSFDVPTSNMRETGRTTRSSTSAPLIPTASNTTSDQPVDSPATRKRTPSAQQSVRTLLSRVRDPKTNYMTGGNPGVFNCFGPPKPGTLDDEELDDDLALMGVRPDGPRGPPSPRYPHVAARDPDMPDCDNLPVSNVRGDPINEQNEILDRTLAMMPVMDADDVGAAHILSNMRSAVQKRDEMDWLVANDKEVRHHSRPGLSEAAKKHEIEVAIAEASHERNMVDMHNYQRNPDIINQAVFGVDPTRKRHDDEELSVEEPAQHKRKDAKTTTAQKKGTTTQKKDAKTTSEQEKGTTMQKKGKKTCKEAEVIEVPSSDSDSTSTSPPDSNSGWPSSQLDTANLDMLAQAAKLVTEPAGTQHDEDELTAEEPAPTMETPTETTAQHKTQNSQNKSQAAKATNKKNYSVESRPTPASPHVTESRHSVNQPEPTNLDILALAAESRSKSSSDKSAATPLNGPATSMQMPAATVNRPIAAVRRTRSTFRSQTATRMPPPGATSELANTNVEPDATGSSPPGGKIHSDDSSGKLKINLKHQTIKYVPGLQSTSPPSPSTSGPAKRKQPTDAAAATAEPEAKKSHKTPIPALYDDWTAIQYDPSAEQRKKNKSKAGKDLAPTADAPHPPSTTAPNDPVTPLSKRKNPHAPSPSTTSTASVAASKPPIPIPAAIQAEYDSILAGTAAPYAAPTGRLRDPNARGPVCGKNGLRLLHAPPACVVGEPPAGGRVVLYIVRADAPGIRAVAYPGREVDWDDKEDVARARQWVMQKLERWGCDRVREDMTARRWLDEEDEVLRVEGRRLVDADPRREKTKKDHARELTKILNDMFAGKEMEGMVRGVQQEKSVGPVRTLDATSTRCERLDDRKFWQNLGLDEGRSKKTVAKANGKSKDAGEEGQSAAAARKKENQSPIKAESGGKGKGVEK